METFANEPKTNDFYLDADGNLAVDSDLDAVLSVCKNVVQTRRFELQYDVNKGIPYFETIFKDSSTLGLWASFVVQYIMGVNGVRSVYSFDLSFNGGESKLGYEAGITTAYGSDYLKGNATDATL